VGGDQAAPPAPPSDAPPETAVPTPEKERALEHVPLVAVMEVNGPGDGAVTPLVGGSATIGRLGAQLTVRLPYDQWVSRSHASLTFREGQWWLDDLGSSNGTWLRDGRAKVTKPTVIALGDVFRVGHTDLMLTEDAHLIRLHIESL